MNKIIIILIMIVLAGCAQKQDINEPKYIIVSKKYYPNISKNAVFDAAKVLFTISNELKTTAIVNNEINEPNSRELISAFLCLEF